LQRLLRQDPALADQVRYLLEVQLLPLLGADEQARLHSIVQTATVSGGVNIQVGRDFHGPVPPAS
jgi:hypothetical protein